MDKISCLVIDDEPLALKLIEGYVVKTPFLDLKGKCRNAFEAIEKLRKEKIKLLFLDIQMPDLSGMEFTRTLSKDIKVIFTTAFSQYAVEGFKVDAIDYLVKPFNYEEFLKAANKANEWFDFSESKDRVPLIADFIFVNSEYNLVKIFFDDILYIEGLKDYVKIYTTKSDRPILTRLNVKAIESKLDPALFVRVQRSFIVSIRKVDSIRKNRLRIGKTEIPFSENFQDNISRILGTNQF